MRIFYFQLSEFFHAFYYITKTNLQVIHLHLQDIAISGPGSSPVLVNSLSHTSGFLYQLHIYEDIWYFSMVQWYIYIYRILQWQLKAKHKQGTPTSLSLATNSPRKIILWLEVASRPGAPQSMQSVIKTMILRFLLKSNINNGSPWCAPDSGDTIILGAPTTRGLGQPGNISTKTRHGGDWRKLVR